MISSYLHDESRFLLWLSKLLDKNNFDIIVTVERKATAILRSLLDLSPEVYLDWDWTKVLSSDALPYLPKGYLKAKRILVFNEMIHHGSSTKKTINAITTNTPIPDTFIETAAFVVHEDFEKSRCWSSQDIQPGTNNPSPNYAIERNVSSKMYEIYRERLIKALKAKGALLLDTEHIESTFSFTLPLNRFFEALWTFGEPVEYEDERIGGFPGITIRTPAVADSKKTAQLLPDNTVLELREPQKIRLVRRGPKEFAFVPIWYPAIEEDEVLKNGWQNAPSYVKPALEKCPSEKLPALAFHLSSLVTGIELVRSIWAGLKPYVGKGVEPQTISASERPGSPLGHLRALYPYLDFTALEEEIASAISSYKDNKLSNIIHKRSGWTSAAAIRKKKARTFIDADTRNEQCLAILKLIVKQQQRFSVGEDWFDDDDIQEAECEDYPPFLWRDIWKAGEGLGLSESLRSIIMDYAIDNAFLKTGHWSFRDRGISYIMRAYQTDSEFVREALERLAYGAKEVLSNDRWL